MCGFTGYLDMRGERRVDEQVLRRMTNTLFHRGPDSDGYFVDHNVALGFRRLSIIDLSGGDQPIFNEDNTVVLMCNGEIYNYLELRQQLVARGHVFRTNSDVEVLLHLYEDEGEAFLNRLNGQFAFVIYDTKRRKLFLARDQFGINPLYFTVTDGLFIFGSEAKAMLEHPAISREVNLTALDQVFSFPGVVAPCSMFKGIQSLQSGHYLVIEDGELRDEEYWDLDYPLDGELAYDKPESFYVETLKELLFRSVRYRLQADVPVGFYLSGGLDSSMIAALINEISPQTQRHSFSIGFTEREISETRYQQLMSRHTNSVHHEIIFGWPEIHDRLAAMIYHCEMPVKETYNTCSMALSKAARDAGITVILTGEGADELFAGYVGYRFDQFGTRGAEKFDYETVMEEELRDKLWGDRNLIYEINQYEMREIKAALYAPGVNDQFANFDCVEAGLVNKERLRGRHFIHQRSYLDFKLRLSDHLISDHGDRMALANSVEGRYPFLDIDIIEFSKQIPPNLKLNGFTEKYILRRVAEGLVPNEILNREKYGFHAPGSPFLLQQKIPWVQDLLSYDRLKRQGYFNPDVVERLKAQYSRPNFKLNLPFENDLLLIVLTFSMFVDTFKLPNFN